MAKGELAGDVELRVSLRQPLRSGADRSNADNGAGRSNVERLASVRDRLALVVRCAGRQAQEIAPHVGLDSLLIDCCQTLVETRIVCMLSQAMPERQRFNVCCTSSSDNRT